MMQTFEEETFEQEYTAKLMDCVYYDFINCPLSNKLLGDVYYVVFNNNEKHYELLVSDNEDDDVFDRDLMATLIMQNGKNFIIYHADGATGTIIERMEVTPLSDKMGYYYTIYVDPNNTTPSSTCTIDKIDNPSQNATPTKHECLIGAISAEELSKGVIHTPRKMRGVITTTNAPRKQKWSRVQASDILPIKYNLKREK